MAAALNILITNNTLARPAGTELSVLDYASALRRRGHAVAAFSGHLGEIAERLRAADVVVVDDLGDLPWTPQVIHGHHEWETTVAALRHPEVPVVSFCRGPFIWQEAPCLAPNVVLWAAVDDACRERLVQEHGVAPDKVEMVFNGIDLGRFTPRDGHLQMVRRVLILSNYASEQNYVPAVRAACAQAGAGLIVIGSAAGNIHPAPHEILGSFDVVLAKGKAALEALAVGAAVVVCDSAGLGPLVTTRNFEALRRLSFGNPCMTGKIDAAGVARRLSEVDPADVARLSALVRETCGLDKVIDRLEAVYARALTAPPKVDLAAFSRFASQFLQSRTQAYKLGRKTQEFWHDQREPDAPDELDAAKADRILDAFFNAETKMGKLQARLEKALGQVGRLKEIQKQMPERSLGRRLRKWLFPPASGVSSDAEG